MTKPNALITGATGWLGKRLIKAISQGMPGDPYFASGQSDRLIKRLTLPSTNNNHITNDTSHIVTCRGDITQPETLNTFFNDSKGATLFHCAGIIHPTWRSKTFYSINVEGTRHIVQKAKQAGIKKLIYISSNSPIGVNPHSEHIFNESSPYHPYMHYGRSKMLAEQIILEAQSDLEVVIIRPPWFYGPGQPMRQTQFFQMIRDGKVPIVGSGQNRRSMAYVDNICQGLLLAEQASQANGQIYWIADEKPYSMIEIVSTIAKILEKDFQISVHHKHLKLPNVIGELAYWIDLITQNIGLYHQKIHVLSEMNKTIACSIEKAQRDLGYQPMFALEEGMRISIQDLIDRSGAL